MKNFFFSKYNCRFQNDLRYFPLTNSFLEIEIVLKHLMIRLGGERTAAAVRLVGPHHNTAVAENEFEIKIHKKMHLG